MVTVFGGIGSVRSCSKRFCKLKSSHTVHSSHSHLAADPAWKLTDNPDDTYDVEADERYRRTDMAAVHAYEARMALVTCVRDGPAQADLAHAALLIAAEDDAIVTHSTVPFPVEAYRARIRKLATECQRRCLAPLQAAGALTPASATAAVARFLYDDCGFGLPAHGRSGLPANAIVDHAGVWEDARHAYLHELLITRRGSAAALAVLHHDLMRQLFLAGAIDFAVRIDCRAFGALPAAAPLPLPRAQLELPGGGMLNTCPLDALVEMLRHLKRAFWPFAWDTALDPLSGGGVGSQGGFRAAALEAIEGPVNAQIQIIAKAAKNRLERGVWTSPGAGDIRRALSAAERLVLLCDEEAPWERRDLGVLLMFRGLPERAKAELLRYSQSTHAHDADAGDRRLLGGLLEVLRDVEPAPEDEIMSLRFYEDSKPPDVENARYLPLTW